MKKYLFILLAALPIILAGVTLSAKPAYPYPIKVVQPDGSTLTIRMHGDEFLHWITCGNSLAVKGDDGYYHYASFQADGCSKVSGGRITSTPGGDGASVRPPQSAVAQATRIRTQWAEAAMNIRRSAKADDAVTGEDHFLVLLIDFNDLKFTVENTTDAFSALLNKEGYSEHNGTGSVRDYYTDQSNGKFKPNFDVYGPYTVSGDMSSYSEDDGTTQNGAPRLLWEACDIADPDIDFSKYDYDGDGVLDNVFFYYAGHNAAAGNQGTIWPHSWVVGGNHVYDGVRLYQYACASEYDDSSTSGRTMASIGTYCHEFAHTIGLPDFYDTDYEEGGQGYGLGDYSLMSAGCYNNREKTPPYFSCEERMLLGWMDAIPAMPRKNKVLTLSPVQNDKGYTCPTDKENEYFYYEFRNGTGWDAPLRPGLIIYHVDKSTNVVNGLTAGYRWENWDGINDYSAHECFKLMLADSDRDIVPFGGRYTAFTANTSPAAISWSMASTGYDLTEITYDEEKASFRLTCTDADMFYEMGLCAIETVSNLKSGDTFYFELVETEYAPSSVKWYFDGNETSSESVVLTAGEHTVKAEVSWSDGDSGYYTAVINVK